MSERVSCKTVIASAFMVLFVFADSDNCALIPFIIEHLEALPIKMLSLFLLTLGQICMFSPYQSEIPRLVPGFDKETIVRWPLRIKIKLLRHK